MKPRLAALVLATPAILAMVCKAQQPEPSKHRGPITGIVVVEEGILGASQAGILLHPLLHPETARIFAVPGFRVQSMAAAADGSVWLAGGIPGESAMLARCAADARQQAPSRLSGHRDMAYAIALSSKGDQVAVAHADGSVRVSAASAPIGAAPWTVRHQHTAPALAATFSADGSLLASGGLDGIVLLSEANGANRKPLHLDDHSAGVECLAFSTDGTRIASGSRDSRVRVHEAATGRLVRTFSGLGMEDEPVAGRVAARITAIVWSEAGLFAGTSKGSVYVLSETDDGSRLLQGPDPAQPVTALLTTEGQLVVAAGERLHSIAIGR